MDRMSGRGQQAVRLTVAQDGTGDYDTVGAALAALGDKDGPPACIFIKEGVYRERLEITRPWITLEGQSAGSTVITWGLSAGMVMEDGSKRGTFRTYSVLVDTHDFTARNLTIENSAGPGEAVGQALALYADGDRILLKGCRLLGGQDTLFTGPLPPKEIQKNGFIGPKQFSPRINGRHCYQDCFIRGDIDFIFGSATAYFDRCELYSAGRNTEKKGVCDRRIHPSKARNTGMCSETAGLQATAPVKASIWAGPGGITPGPCSLTGIWDPTYAVRGGMTGIKMRAPPCFTGNTQAGTGGGGQEAADR